MQAVVRTILLLGVVTACGSPHVTHDGGGDDDVDASPNGPGLTVQWSTKAPIPGTLATDLTLSTMIYRLANLRVIGDAGPGDTRTSQDNFSVSWDGSTNPPALVFTDAPSGLYSKVIVLADANFIDYAWELHGTVKYNGETHDYKIHDRTPLGLSLDTNATLDPGHGTKITIKLDLAMAFDGLDWSKLTNDNGTLELDTFDDAMSDFRNRMASNVFTASKDGGQN